jgi:hypothetical protein
MSEMTLLPFRAYSVIGMYVCLFQFRKKDILICVDTVYEIIFIKYLDLVY